MNYNSNDFKSMRDWSFYQKIKVAENKIREWYEHYDGNVYIAFSGGKDSTVLLDLVRSIYPDVPAVFVDTGLEYPEVKEFVKTFDNVEIIKPKHNFKKVIDKYGYPLISKQVAHKIYTARRTPGGKVANEYFTKDSDHYKKNGRRFSYQQWAWLKDTDIPIGDQCCLAMKKRPFYDYENRTRRVPFIATLAEESTSRKNIWYKYGCNAFDATHPSSRPLSIWTEQNIFEYIKYAGLRYCKIYGNIIQNLFGEYQTTGVERTGCIFCGFGIHREKEPNRFQQLKKSHPNIYEYCMRKENGLGMKEVFDKINDIGKIKINYE